MPTAFSHLHPITPPFHPNHFIILPPPPSLPKTPFPLNIPQNLPTNTHQTLAIFTLHIAAHQLLIPIL
ncbi:DnaB-like helicase C-terminal domain-containing protein, partial [Bacillus altitudinis]|uniref:DnaB-like helicase C-terminal domain-containing protein n=1 Tax=Bacillus altitudinis TaxID=293387 RepID=UPI003B52D193